MPLFELLPIDKVIPKSATWNTVQTMREYLSYIDQLSPGHVDRLQPTEGETIHAVRRRLGAAARSCGKGLEIKQLEDAV